MEWTDFDTRAVGAGAVSMALLGIGGTLALGQSILLIPVALVGGFVSGYLSRPGTTVTNNATAGTVVGYLLVAPVIVGRAVMADDFVADASVGDSALLQYGEENTHGFSRGMTPTQSPFSLPLAWPDISRSLSRRIDYSYTIHRE